MASESMMVSGASGTVRADALAQSLKRSYDSLSDNDRTMPLEEFGHRVKRQRQIIYDGLTDREPESKAGLILQLGAWLCRHHTFGLMHPISKTVQQVSCSSMALPLDIVSNPWHADMAGQPNFASNKKGLCGTAVESLILSTAIGRQQLATYSGLIRAASFLIAVIDSTVALQCAYCKKRCTDKDVHLMTVAEEYTPTCQHPKISDDDVVWASDDQFENHDLYGSRCLPGKEHEREGSAICLSCLYEHVMMHDAFLTEDLSTWFAFEIASMRNLLEPKEETVRRLCSCEHPTIPGAMCLFRFSKVLPPVSGQGIYAITTAVNIPQMIATMMNTARDGDMEGVTLTGVGAGEIEPSYQFDEYDPVVTKMLESSTRFSSRLFPPPSATVSNPTAAALDALINRRFDFSDTLIRRLEATLALGKAPVASTHPALPLLQSQQQQQPQVTSAWSPSFHVPTPEEQSTMNTEEHYAFMERSLPIVEAYYQSATCLSSTYSSNLFINHDTPDRMPPFCRACGTYGHPQIKTCPFATNKKITPRNNTTRSVHFADNVKTFIEDNRAALAGITGKNQWEASAMLHNAKEMLSRIDSSKLARRGGPSPSFIGTAASAKEGGRVKRAPIPTMTPSISFETLASIPANLYASTLDVELFTSIDYYVTANQHWSANRIACADMEDLHQWLLELKTFCPATNDFAQFVENNQDAILASLYAFVQRRKRHVMEQRILGDELSLATMMIAEAPLTGWTNPNAQKQQPPSTLHHPPPPPPTPSAQPHTAMVGEPVAQQNNSKRGRKTSSPAKSKKNATKSNANELEMKLDQELDTIVLDDIDFAFSS